MRFPTWLAVIPVLAVILVSGRLLAAAGEPPSPVLGTGGDRGAHADQRRPESETHPLGLYVSESGELMKDGEPFAGIGVNYFNLFARLLANPGDTSYRAGLKALADHEIPFVRFMAGGYWPVDNRLYFEDKERYFELFDQVVATAEEFGIGLVPSLFWAYATVPDLMDEPVSAWGDPESKTRAFMRTYVEELVTRYKDSPALWGWEFGNEYNLMVDLPNAAEHRAPVWPELGTRTSRGPEDDLKRAMVRSAFQDFAQEVRRHDPHRIITNGNSLPRPSEWHQTQFLSWQQDTVEQFEEVILGDSPDPMNVISVHLYDAEERRFGRTTPVAEVLAHLMRISQAAGKPLFVGEFGASERNGHQAGREAFFALLDAIVDARVPLSALWVYDFPGQDGEWNVTAWNNRAYQLWALQEANRALRRMKWLDVTGPHLTTVRQPALLRVAAADPAADLSRVVVRLNGAVLAENPALPFEWTFRPAQHPEGAQRFEVEAVDAAGRTVTWRLSFQSEVIDLGERPPVGRWSGVETFTLALGAEPGDVANFQVVLQPVRGVSPAYVVYEGGEAPETLAVDTNAVEDGAYDLIVRLESVFGTRYERVAAVLVRNWESFSDPFDPPATLGWFGVVDRSKTAYRSSNWEYGSGDPAAFFGDDGRLVRTEDADAHLAWEVDGIDELELTVYTPAGVGDAIDWPRVLEAVVIDGAGRRALALSAVPGATSEAGWTRWYIRAQRSAAQDDGTPAPGNGDTGEENARATASGNSGAAPRRPVVELRVRTAGVAPEHIQLGRIDIRYRLR